MPQPFDLRVLQPETAFEGLRQERETRNERIINLIQMAHFAIVLFANIVTHFAPVAPYQASAALLAVLTFSLAMRVGLWFYFRSQPVYSPWRKYLISTADLVIFTASPVILGLDGAYPWLFLGVFAVCVYAILIALSGLRYSSATVAYNGVAAMVLHVAIFPWLVPSDYLLPVFTIGFLTLGAVGVSTAVSVRSLIQLQAESALKDKLSRFLPAELVEEVTRDPSLLTRRTERRTATVIFADIRGFTRLSERMEPEKVVEFLNEFLEEMTSAILDHRGMLDKYIGDAVMGVFGVPVHSERHPHRALRTALDMRERLKKLNAKLSGQGLPELSIGIGVHTGELLIGAIGSTRRLDYTVIGDTVNVASRIEGMTRSYPVEILVSDSTRLAVASTFQLHEIATVQVKNREEPLVLWSPDPPVEEVA